MFPGLTDFLRTKRSFLLLLLVWLLVGMFGGPLAIVVIPLSLLILINQGRFDEALLGFFLILMLSDSRQQSMGFAAQAKDFCMLMMAGGMFLFRESFMPMNRIVLRFLPFFAFALIGLIYSQTIGPAAQKTLSYFLILLVVPNYIMTAWRTQGPVFFRNLVFFTVLLLVIGFALRVLRPEVVTLQGRYTGILGNPNGLGIFVFLFTMIFVYVDTEIGKVFTRYERWLIYGVAVVSILLCNSRSALLALLIFFGFRYLYRFSPVLGFVIFLSISLGYQYLMLNFESVVFSLGLQDYFRVETLESGSGRIIAWSYCWLNIQEGPFFFGYGFNYTEYLFRKHFVELSLLGHQGNAHNSYLTMWLDTGLLGLISYLGGFISAFIRGARQTKLALPVMYAVLFSVSFESWLTASLNPFTIQVVILMTLMLATAELKAPSETEQAEGSGEEVPVTA